MKNTEVRLSRNGVILVIALMFCLLLGGYFVGTDLYHYHDSDSAVTVLVLYILMGLFGILFLLGKKHGLWGLMGLSGILMIAQIVYVLFSLTDLPTGPGWHDPSLNWFITGLDILFSLLVFIFSSKVYRER
jgi:hypothetical protein